MRFKSFLGDRILHYQSSFYSKTLYVNYVTHGVEMKNLKKTFGFLKHFFRQLGVKENFIWQNAY